MQFEVGDVVELRSGGPAMTVMGHDDDEPPRLACSYFRGDELTTLGFDPGVLAMSPDKDRYSPSGSVKTDEPTLHDGMIDAVAR